MREDGTMDPRTLPSFQPWLDTLVDPVEHDAVTRDIHKFLNRYPDVIESHTWSEIWDMAEWPSYYGMETER
jgi:hypothetical protein